MSNAFAHHISKRELLIFYYKYRRRMLASFLIPFLLCLIISFLPTPRYQAQSVLIVRLGSEYVYQPEVGTNQNSTNPTIPFDREQVAKSEVAILESDDLHRKVIEAIGVENLYPELTHSWKLSWQSPDKKQSWLLAKAVEKFNRRFDISLKKESAVITLSFEHKDSTLAAQTLETLLKIYFEKRRQLYLEPRAELAETQMNATHAHALQAEQAVADFKHTHKIYSLTSERDELLSQRSDIQKQLTVINSAGLEQELAGYNKRLDELDAQEREFNNLQNEAKIADESYTLYSHKLDEAKAYEDLQHERIGSVRVIQPPTSASEPRNLQPLIILGGFFLSLFCMLFTAAVTEFSKRGFITPEQIERHLNLPVLAVIPFQKP